LAQHTFGIVWKSEKFKERDEKLLGKFCFGHGTKIISTNKEDKKSNTTAYWIEGKTEEDIILTLGGMSGIRGVKQIIAL
jgi:hypothetical protein